MELRGCWSASRQRAAAPTQAQPRLHAARSASSRPVWLLACVLIDSSTAHLLLLQTKAKAIRKYVDKMIGLAKEGTLHARRQALGFVYDPELVKSLFEQVRLASCGY